MLDKIGNRNGLIIFAIFLVAGQGLVTLGGSKMNFNLMLVGRCVYGMGCESMYVGQSAIVSNWFINYELPIAISMVSTIPLIGSFLNGIVVPQIYDATQDFGKAFGIGFILCIISFLMVLIVACIDKRAESYDKRLLLQFRQDRKERERRTVTEQISMARAEDKVEEEEVQIRETFKQGQDIENNFSLKDLKLLGLPFWLTTFSCMCTYISVVNSVAIGSALLQNRFNYSEIEAGFFFGLPYTISACACPLVGIFVNRYGRRMTVTMLGSLLLIISHTLMMLLPECDKCFASKLPLILQGLGYTTYSVVLWGSFPYIVEARALGTAFGICTAFQNMGTVVAPIIVGLILEGTEDVKFSKGGYLFASLFFVLISCLALIFNIWVYLYDKQKRENLLESKKPLAEFERYTQ